MKVKTFDYLRNVLAKELSNTLDDINYYILDYELTDDCDLDEKHLNKLKENLQKINEQFMQVGDFYCMNCIKKLHFSLISDITIKEKCRHCGKIGEVHEDKNISFWN